MNNINFHSLKKIPVPEELRNKVIAIPENKGKKSIIHLDRIIRIAAACLSVVIIVAVSVVLFRNTGNNNPIAVQPFPNDGTEAPSEDGDIAPNSTTLPLSTEELSSYTTSPAETHSTDPTEADFVDLSQHGTDAPPQPSTAPTSSTIAPVSKPTSKPAEPSTDAPTEAPTEKQSPWRPHPPTEAAWFPPGDDPGREPTGVSTQLLRSLRPADGKVYCRIETIDGEAFGDYGMFDEERLMTNLGSNGEYYIYYYRFADHYSVPFKSETDTFDCIVYDSNGNALATTQIHWS